MMNMSEMMLPPELTSDAELVAASLAGDRNAFGRIVERYQRLLCSLAYSGTGNLSESEDVAQEAFVEAWRQLGKLREPEKLRSWLCGILRHKVSRLRRSDHREPVRGAESMDAAGELNSDDEPVADQTMREEEQAMMWNALARVPEIYREPLVLYYREHRSVEHVASALDLSEDAVKQRLSRGRKVLQDQVMAFVEGALVRSTPGKVFTVGVLAMLPAMVPTTAKAAGVGAAAVKGGMLAKTTGLATLVASLAGVFSAIMSLRVALDQSRTQRERRAVVRTTIGCIGGVFAPLVVLYAMRAGAYRWPAGSEVLAWSAQGVVLLFMVIWPWAFVRVLRAQRVLRSAERRRHPERFEHEADHVGAAAGEYRSKATLLGVPLVHVRFAQADEGARPVCGWIASTMALMTEGGAPMAPASPAPFTPSGLVVQRVRLKPRSKDGRSSARGSA